MSVTPSYRQAVEDQLGAVVPALKTRSMFGGLGIYSGSHFFALVDDDVLYFKVDDANRPDFESRGMGPFCPFGDPNMVMHYYRVPDDVFHDAAQLRSWAAKAIAVARNKPIRKTRSKKKSK
jgi:DNA transformation protein and related proteins